MLIRRARPEDHEAVGRVTVAAYAPFMESRDDSDYMQELRDGATRDREAELWVAVDDEGAVLGSVTSCPEGSPWRELSRPGQGEFRMLGVDPAAQGQGVGAALVQHVVDGFRAEGVSEVVLCSMSTMTPAHRLYGRLGFVRAPELDWSPVPGIDLLAFRLPLDPPPPR
jgi:ribosomal protein S18 acetylase RimI-like enzyme